MRSWQWTEIFRASKFLVVMEVNWSRFEISLTNNDENGEYNYCISRELEVIAVEKSGNIVFGFLSLSESNIQ